LIYLPVALEFFIGQRDVYQHIHMVVDWDLVDVANQLIGQGEIVQVQEYGYAGAVRQG